MDLIIGKRKNAVRIIRGVGGKAFPNDYNWICDVCGNDNRAFEETCQNCEHRCAMKYAEIDAERA